MALSEDSRNSGFNAHAGVVNRTHRVIRERAMAMQQRKRSTRELVVPFIVCSALLLLIAFAVLTLADETFTGLEGNLWRHVLALGEDAGNSVSLLLMWFLPLSVITAAVVLLRRNRRNNDRQNSR